MRREVKYGQVWAYYGDVQCMALYREASGRYPNTDGQWRVLLLAIAPGVPYEPEAVDRFITYTLETQAGWEELE